MIYAAARDITEHKAAEELRARNTNVELLDAKLAALTDTGELSDVVDRVSDIAQNVLPHDAMVLPVLLPDRAHVRFHVTKAPDGAKFPEVMEIPEHLRNSDVGVTTSLTIFSRIPRNAISLRQSSATDRRFVFPFASRASSPLGLGFSRLRHRRTNRQTFSLRVASPIGWP